MALKDYDIIEDLKPHGGGWRFMQPMADGQIFRIPTQGSLQSGRDLCEAVKIFRINNSIPLGNIELDVADYIRRVSPYNDTYRGRKAILYKAIEQPFVALIYRIKEWLDKLAPTKPELVDVIEANRRAEICIACEQNIRWKVDCGPCNEAIEYLARNTRNLTDYALDDALLGCRIHGCHLPTLVFLDRGYLPDRIDKQPAHCWIPENAHHGHDDNKLPDPHQAQS